MFGTWNDPITARGELAVNYRWTKWVWEITGWSWRLQSVITNRLRGIYRTYLKWMKARKQNRKTRSTCNRWALEWLGSSPTMPKNFPGTGSHVFCLWSKVICQHNICHSPSKLCLLLTGGYFFSTNFFIPQPLHWNNQVNATAPAPTIFTQVFFLCNLKSEIPLSVSGKIFGLIINRVDSGLGRVLSSTS